MDHTRNSIADLALDNANLLQTAASEAEVRITWVLMGLLVMVCVVTVPFADKLWPASTLLFSGAGVASFAEVTTGVLLLSQALPLRHYAGLALGIGYLLGGLVIFVNIFLVRDVSTRLWVFRLWHTVFVTGVVLYAWMHGRVHPRFSRRKFLTRARVALAGSGVFLTLLILYVEYMPFTLPAIYHHGFYATTPNIVVNAIQLVVMFIAWWLLLMAPEKTALSSWMCVVACAVVIDILLFVLGGRMFSVGLYISKLNNLVAATMIFGLIFYRQVRIQNELFYHRASLLRDNRKLARLAMTDSLTGLPNRGWLDETLEREVAWAKRHNAMIAVCVIDLDDFKPVNDRYGHPMGDRLLVEFSRHLSEVLRREEHLVRLGGDEFVLILKDIQHLGEVPGIMKRVADAISVPFELSPSVSVKVGASIGVAIYPYIVAGGDLVREADQALYRSKQDKANRERIWTVHEVEGMPKLFG